MGVGGGGVYTQTLITRPSKDKKVHDIVVEEDSEELSADTHKEVPTLPNKLSLL